MTTKKTKIIPISLYIKDVQARWKIHLYEFNLFIEDVINAGRYTRKVLNDAINSKHF